MYTICLRYAKNTDHAADILQDAFIKIYEKRQLFDPKYPLAGWIKRIVINQAVDHYRANKRFEYITDDKMFEEVEAENDEISVDAALNLHEILNEVLMLLPDGYRTVFQMYVFDNLKHQEIAEYLGVSVNTSKTQLSKARKMIRLKLEEKNITRSTVLNG